MVTSSKIFIFLGIPVWIVLFHIFIPSISSSDYIHKQLLSSLLKSAPAAQPASVPLVYETAGDFITLSTTSSNPGDEGLYPRHSNSHRIMRSGYAMEHELYDGGDEDEYDDSSSYSESEDEDRANYWEYCKNCETKGYGHYGHSHSSHHTYPFIVLIKIDKCYSDSSEEEYHDSETYGTGFIVSPHCVITTSSLVSPTMTHLNGSSRGREHILNPYSVREYYNENCLNITVLFCQNHCSNKPYLQYEAFNRTIIVKRNESEEESYVGNSCVFHPDYDSETLVYNIAILQLKDPIPFGCVKPACWNDRKTEPYWYYPDLHRFSLMICGYGADNTYDGWSRCPRCISCRQGTQKQCANATEQEGQYITPYDETCALCNETALCYGGTGSVILHTPSNREYGCPAIIGFASWTLPDCTKARPVVYISTLLKKISRFIKLYCDCSPLPPPDTDDDYDKK